MQERVLNLSKQIITMIFLNVFLFSAPVSAKLSIIRPIDNSVTEKSAVVVTGSEDTADKDEIKITVKGRTQFGDEESSETVFFDDRVFNHELELYEGENEIIAGNIHIKIFYDNGAMTVPDGFAKAFYHKPLLTGCADCHDTQEKGVPLLARENSLCAKCHELSPSHHSITGKSDGKKIKIAPRFKKDWESFICTGCHDPHASFSENLFAPSKDVLCKRCHKDL